MSLYRVEEVVKMNAFEKICETYSEKVSNLKPYEIYNSLIPEEIKCISPEELAGVLDFIQDAKRVDYNLVNALKN